jgi:L-ascorbate metabolism protein UlaG (beta-lactamase superfamily)
MQISYLGFDCLRLTASGVTIIVHPLNKDCGLPVGKNSADIVITQQDDDYEQGRGTAFVINNPGEYEVKGVFISGHYLKKQRQTVYLITADGVHLLFLGRLKNSDLSASDIEFFKLADVLAIPVGGNGVLTATQAADLINEVEPRIVLPIIYAMDGLKGGYAPVETFIKSFGGKAEKVDKLKINKSDLPTDDVLTYIIQPSN